MNLGRKCNYISNSYYNLGLEMAKERNLTDAAEYLKRSLQFNKTNTDARNLLGLIYNEIGEVADALVQWIISYNLNPDNNIASFYIDTIKSNQNYFDRASQALIKFNQTLGMAKSGGDDLAVIQLQKITEVVPNYVRAQLLLASLYLYKQNNKKAMHAISAVMKVDHGNPTAIRYLSLLKAAMNKAEKTKKKDSKAEEGQGTIEEPVAVPTAYKEANAFQTIVNIALGLAIGAASILFLYLPNKTAQITEEANKSVITISEKLNQANKEIQQQQLEYQKLQEEHEAVLGAYAGSDEVISHKFLQYQLLLGSINYTRSDNYIEAGRLYSKIEPDLLTDIEDESGVKTTEIYQSLRNTMNTLGYNEIVHQADVAYEAKEYQNAYDLYQLAVAVVPNDPVAMYKEGRALEQLGNREEAVKIWTEVIQNNSGTDIAEMAKRERGY